jgi:DNA-binding ferritin-like protein
LERHRPGLPRSAPFKSTNSSTSDELSDVVAERSVAIGVAPDGRAPAVIAQSELEPVEPGPTDVPDAVHQLTRALEKQLWMIRSQL